MLNVTSIKLLLSKYKLYVYAALAVSVIAGVAYVTHTTTASSYQVKLANIEAENARLDAENKELGIKASEKTTEVVTKYVDRVKVVREKGDTIVKEVPIYVTKEANEQCKLTQGFADVHDAAAKNEPVKPNADVNKPLDKTLAEATGVVTDNYKKFHETREQLMSLQEWVKTQSNLINKKSD
jgi:hypothetical protein